MKIQRIIWEDNTYHVLSLKLLRAAISFFLWLFPFFSSSSIFSSFSNPDSPSCMPPNSAVCQEELFSSPPQRAEQENMAGLIMIMASDQSKVFQSVVFIKPPLALVNWARQSFNIICFVHGKCNLWPAAVNCIFPQSRTTNFKMCPILMIL